MADVPCLTTLKSILLKALFLFFQTFLRASYLIGEPVGNRVSLWVFGLPLFQNIRDEERALLSKATTQTVMFEGKKLRQYTWGMGSKKVLFCHGWRGNAGNFQALIKEFDLEQHTLVAYDAPAHNQSSGNWTNVIQFARLAKHMIAVHSPTWVVSHSVGSAAVITALHELGESTVKKAVLLSTPNNLFNMVKDFSTGMKLPAKAAHAFQDHVQQRLGKTYEDSKIEKLIPAISLQILLIHDTMDRVLDFSEAQKVADANPEHVTLLPIEKVGHFKLLRDRFVVEQVKQFLGI